MWIENSKIAVVYFIAQIRFQYFFIPRSMRTTDATFYLCLAPMIFTAYLMLFSFVVKLLRTQIRYWKIKY